MFPQFCTIGQRFVQNQQNMVNGQNIKMLKKGYKPFF